MLFAESDWTKASAKNYKENSRDLLDTILNDPAVARLYWALSRLDPETRNSLQQSIGLGKLLPYAAVLDFYGRGLCISGGRVSVPGGAGAEAAWKDLVGASPASPAAFVSKLLAKDKGWLIAYFDVLSRVSGTQQAYFTDPHRLPFFYAGTARPGSFSPRHQGFFQTGPGTVASGQLDFSLRAAASRSCRGISKSGKTFFSQWHNSNFARKLGKQTSRLTSRGSACANDVCPVPRVRPIVDRCRCTWRSVNSTADDLRDIDWHRRRSACWRASSRNSAISTGSFPSFRN